MKLLSVILYFQWLNFKLGEEAYGRTSSKHSVPYSSISEATWVSNRVNNLTVIKNTMIFEMF